MFNLRKAFINNTKSSVDKENQDHSGNVIVGIFKAVYELIVSIPKNIKVIQNAKNNTSS